MGSGGLVGSGAKRILYVYVVRSHTRNVVRSHTRNPVRLHTHSGVRLHIRNFVSSIAYAQCW